VQLITKIESTYQIQLFIAGPVNEAKQIIRKEVLKGGLCVTITPVDYLYLGGEESGYVVGLLQYPRYPESQESLRDKARHLMQLLLEGTFQKSGLMVTPELTEWVSIVGQ
jgi:hypothetical protein